MKTKHALTAIALVFAFESSAFTKEKNSSAAAKSTASVPDTESLVQGMKVIKIPAGQTATLGPYVNSTGTVNIIIKTRDGTDEVPEMWWITWGLGKNVSLGKRQGSFHFPVPIKLWKGIFAAKLRARAGSSDTIIYLRTSGDAPAGGVTFQW